jgi:hypothetical protein
MAGSGGGGSVQLLVRVLVQLLLVRVILLTVSSKRIA